MMKFSLIDDFGNLVRPTVTEYDGYVKIRFDASEVKDLSGRIAITSKSFESKIGEDGFYLGGVDFSRYTSFLTRFIPRDDFVLEKGRSLIGAFGVSNESVTCLGVITGMCFDYLLSIEKKGDTYSLSIVYDLDKTDIYEDIELTLYPLEKGSTYVDMAKKYRTHMLTVGKCRSLKDKIKERPSLDYLKDSIEIRIRMAWKPAPADVLEQTEENEPPIYVACTFDDVARLVGRLKEEGISKVQICLVGWNKSGHDGRWPDAFPVEPLLGGEEKLRELIEYTRSCGYNIVCHTNSTDCYSISKRFDGGSITLKNKEQSPVSDKCVWSGGRMYHLCPIKAWEFAKQDLVKIKDLGFVGSHYIDVMSIISLRTCHDPEHPCNPSQTDTYFEKIADLCRENFGGFASEGSFDHSARYLDFGLYTKFNRKKYEGMDEGVNFHEIAFHGIFLANAGSQTINYTIKGDDERLIMAELVYRPAMYLYSRFKKDGRSWMGSEDLSLGTDDELERAVKAVKDAYEDYSKLSHLQTEFIENYTVVAKGVYSVDFSDGSRITVNYNEDAVNVNGEVIGGKSYSIRNLSCQ